MAKIDSLILKTSDYSQEDLFSAILGLTTNGPRPERLEQGEIVLRYTGEGFLVDENGQQILDPEGEPIRDTPEGVELWTLNKDGKPTQIRLDLSAEVPEYDLAANIGSIEIGELKDVKLGDLVPSQVLTFDGLNWVNRDLPEFGGEGSIIPTLNEVGDINYGAQAASNKFGPEFGDVLFYTYDETQAKYTWAPFKLDIDLIDGLQTRQSEFILDRSKVRVLTFGNPVISSYEEARYGLRVTGKVPDGAGVGFSWGNRGIKYIDAVVVRGRGEGTFFYQTGDIILKPLINDIPSDDLSIGTIEKFRLNGIKYDTIEDVPVSLPDDTYLATLSHVRGEFSRLNIGGLFNVNDVGILQGQVLGWDSISQEYRPLSGVAPDLSVASIGDFSDVTDRGKARGMPLTWDKTTAQWVPERLHAHDLLPAYYTRVPDLANDPETGMPDLDKLPQGADPLSYRPPTCDEANLGRIVVFNNEPHICLRCRDEEKDGQNRVFGYVQLLLDGIASPFGANFSPKEYAPQIGFGGRTDPLSTVAYEGTLGGLYNVSTADVFQGASLVYNESNKSFTMDYPALDLTGYSIGQLGDVDPRNAGVGYGLLWDGEGWYASSLDQKVRLDDLQDVAFGALGVSNTKMVAAFMLSTSEKLGPTYSERQDVSTLLAVSTPKGDLFPGTTKAFLTNQNNLTFAPPTQGVTVFDDWRNPLVDPAMTLAELLDLYVRWNNDPSWQTIDGDGCIEIYFYPTLLLDDRTILKKHINFQGKGGYILQLTQSGGLYWNVVGPEGSGGFTITTPVNIVSMQNWHHVALVKQGASNRLYLDGFLIGEAPSSAAWTGDGLFVLGRNDLDDNNTLKINPFRGYMADLRVTKGRPKYEGAAHSLPDSIENEIIDTTPNPGDFLSYDGTKWTNVNGVEGDISNKSIDELADVNTVTTNPVIGDALVWTGAQWEPGIPGIGASWGLNDFTDVQTFYQTSTPTIKFSQAERIAFADAFHFNKEDIGVFQQLRSGNYAYGLQLGWLDANYKCGIPDAEFNRETTNWVGIDMKDKGQLNLWGRHIRLKNIFKDCKKPPFGPVTFHEDTLYYDACPDRPGTPPPQHFGETFGSSDVPDTFVPCWGVIEDHINEALAYGNITALKDVSGVTPTLGQALIWNGSIWTPSSDIAADISQNSIGDLADVSVGGLDAGDFLRWSGTSWRNYSSLFDSLEEIPGVDYETVGAEPNQPIQHSALKCWQDLGFFTEAAIEASPDHSAFTGQRLLEVDGIRGYQFYGGTTSVLFNNQYHSTTLTSGLNKSQVGTSWIELNPEFIRFSGQGEEWGKQGLLVGDNLVIRYENTARTINGYGEFDVIPKGMTLDYIDNGLQNLDLSRNILENIGNVETTGKTEGWALVWDGTNWIASPSVAADISLSSVGDLSDVSKVLGESLTLDVPRLLTSAPTQAQGGVEIPSSTGNARIGWSDDSAGSPLLENVLGTFVGSRPVFLSVEAQQIRVGGDGGILYANDPVLSELTIPSFQQVKKQIVRELTDFSALFFLNGETFNEQNYGWDLDVQVTTQPNPAYFSKFDGSSSYRFSKISSDKIVWTTQAGCPLTWSMNSLWAFEFWVYIDSSALADGYNELILSPIGATKGVHVAVSGADRSQIFFVNGNVGPDSTQPTGGAVVHQGAMDKWTHVLLQQEGNGLIRFYVDGGFVGESQSNEAVLFEGGLSIGGRSQGQGSASVQSYFTGNLDDIRITKGFLPYEVGQDLIPVPIGPLPPGAFQSTFGKLSSLSDVNTLDPEPINGNVLMWDNVAGQWKPGPPDALSYDISSSEISDLSDVDANNQANAQGDILAWNAITNKWERTRVDGNGGVRSIHARSASPGAVPQMGTLFAGEFFINMADKKVYTLDDAGQPFTFATEASLEGILGSVDRVVGGTF